MSHVGDTADLAKPNDLATGADAGGCGPNDWTVVPCCGGPAPLPDAAPCTPAPPYCLNPSAPPPIDCILDRGTRTYQCVCA